MTCNGINCEILAQSFIFYANSTTTGNFMHVLNGGTLRIDSGECKSFGTGLYVENTGVMPQH